MVGSLYDELRKVSEDTNDTIVERYGIITKEKENGYYTVQELETDLVHENVQSINGLTLHEGEQVLLGFSENSIYNPIILGTTHDKVVYTVEEVDTRFNDILNRIEKLELENSVLKDKIEKIG